MKLPKLRTSKITENTSKKKTIWAGLHPYPILSEIFLKGSILSKSSKFNCLRMGSSC